LFATHLVGGNLAYTYLGDTDGDGNFNYLVTFQTFLDCNSPFWLNGFPEPTLDIGIYEGVGIPSGNLPLVMIATLPLIDSSSIIPVPTNGCLVGQSVCLYQATYQIEVDLPNSFQGYHLFYDRCCRTGSVINLNNPGNQGLAFHAYIAPTLVNNSSPIFSDVPVPFLCVNDTASILNTAVDPDGDVLLFSFADPYQGFGNSGNPAPPLPNPSLPWPIPTVNWLNASYNQNNPFGPAGFAFINGTTGLTQYMAPLVGDYVVAVEIREFRNGNLIGITRRDIQIVVINCPPNPPPNLSPTGGSGITQYTLEECDTLSFPIIFEDPNGDSLTLITGGQIFDTSFVNPAATIDSLVIGDSTVTANFNWQTSCGTAQALPYLFTVSVTDNGCPPKTTNIVYQVTVEPPAPPDSIIGPLLICQTSNGIYSVNAFPGYTYTWTVTNGTILSGQGTGSIGVNWPNVGSGTVSVTGISDCGCPSASIDTTVTILSAPIADAGNDTTICLGDSVLIGGSPTGPLGTIFLWSPNTNINNTTIANPLVWPSTTTSYIVAVDNGICVTNDTVIISVGSANINAGVDTSICLGDFTQLNASGGITYSWSPGGSLSDSTISNPTANPIVTTTYVATITDSLGCTGVDSIIVTVDTFPTIIISGDTSICLGDCAQITVSGGVSYLWSPGGTLSDSTISNPVACPINTTTYYVDVSNSSSCISKDSLVVTINPTPIITTNNDTAVCDGICVQLNTNGGVSYIWTPTTGLSNGTIANPLACPLTTTTYVVSGVDANGCSSNDTVTITINPLPIVDAGNDQGICVSGAVVIGGAPTGPSGATYLWSPGATLDDNTLSNPTATPLVTTTYTVTVTDTNGCVDFDVITISINSIPTVNAGNDTTICVGESLVIGGSPTGPTSATFNWTPAGSLNNNTFPNPVATPNVTTEYIVTVTDSNGCIGIDSVLVTANILPIIITNNDTAVCDGICVQLNTNGGVSYIWTPTTALSNGTIANPLACPLTTTTYVVSGVDVNGCSNNDTVTITINPLPIVDAGNDQGICVSGAVVIGGAPTGPSGATYLWSPGATLDDNTLSNPTATPLVTTTYTVTVTDTNGCVDFDVITISINSIPTVNAGNDTTICIGESLVIGGSPTGPTSATFNWTPAGSLNNNTLPNPIATPAVTTEYIITVTDSNGCIGMDSVLVTANILPIIITNNDTSICFGDCAQLNATGGTGYVWTPPGTLSNSNIFNPIACPNSNTTYIVTVTDANNCVDTASVSVTINPLPTILAGPDLWLCTGDSIQLNATGGISYLWTPSIGLNDSTIANPMANPLTSTNYIVTGFDVNGCSSNDTILITVNDDVPIAPGTDTTICAGDSVVLGGAPTSPIGTSYIWFPNGGTINDDTLANPTVFPTITTTYYVVATNDTCTAIDSVTITINSAPTINAGVDIDICIGDSIQLNAIGGINYIWQPGGLLTDSTISNPIGFPNDTTEFIVFGTDLNGCSAFDSVIVNVNPLPIISAGAATSICSGDSIQLIATGGVSYLWTPGSSLSDSTISNPNAFPLGTTTYIVTGIDAIGCSNLDSLTVTVNQLNITDLTDTIICIGEALQLTVNGPSGATYLWTPSTNLSNTTIFNPITTTQVTITYIVTVTDSNGCIDTTSILVTAEPKPTAIFTLETAPVCDGISAEFTNLSIGATSYLWNFGDGEQSAEINPIHVFAYGLSHTVILTAYSFGLCSDTTSFVINTGNFEEYFNITPPTVLTPNRDGMNDLFKIDLPDGVGNCTDIKVFNRWGMKVYDSYGQNSGWDGRTTTGTKVPEGTYFYIIEINGITKKGSLTLMD
jgi:gliding motility-associated-like protein